MRLLASLAGIVLVVLTLWDVFSIMVVTRRATRQLQLSSLLISLFRRLYIGVGQILQDRGQRENFLGVLGPLLLFVRFAVWALALILGYALLQWGAGERIASPDGAATFGTLLYYSGTTFFTVALGDLTPLAAWPRALNILEAATGFMFLGLVISYLPTFYADYARREARISQLDAWASSPPSAGELLSRLGREDALPILDSFLGDWETWAADVMESHLSYPILALFRSQHEDQSWVSALATVLDVSALVLVGIDGVNPRAARLAFAMARHAAVDLSQVFGHPRRAANVDRLPSIELARLRAQLSAHGVRLAAGQAADARLFELRAMYEPYLVVLSERLFMPLPKWLPDADARDNWQRTA
jgi:Ion channel